MAFSCRGRCFCPSCHQKRALQTAHWVSQDVCAPVPRRQFVFTIPKRLRIYFRFDRRLLREGKITEEIVANIRGWRHSGFGVDQSVRLEAEVSEGIVGLIEYFLRCPFSQARMIEVTNQGKVIYKTGDNRLGRFPEAASEDLLAGPKRNFQIFDPLDFLAEVTQHIPNPGEHLIRYYGWYSNKNRGLRAKAQGARVPAVPKGQAVASPSAKQARKRWAAPIKQVYESDPLCCPKCGAEMRIISFIERHQTEAIEKILRHCGLWEEQPAKHEQPRPLCSGPLSPRHPRRKVRE